MADVNEVTDGAAPVQNTETSTAPATPQYSEVEQRAMEQGWVPEDQYTGTGKWRTAEDFLDRGELFSKIDDLNRKLKSQERVLVDFKKHYTNVQKEEFERALNTLRAEKRTALEEGDAEAVIRIDDKIADVRETKCMAENQASQPMVDETAPPPQFVAWVNRNNWYTSDRAMKVFADDVGRDLALKGLSPMEVLTEVERQVKKEFSHKFNNPNRTKTSSVEGGGSRGSSKSHDGFVMDEQETAMMKRFVKAGVLTEAQYIADLKKAKGFA